MDLGRSNDIRSSSTPVKIADEISAPKNAFLMKVSTVLLSFLNLVLYEDCPNGRSICPSYFKRKGCQCVHTCRNMRDPKKILVKSEDLTLEGISQYYIAVEKEEWKMEVLLDLYSNLDINQALIYCNTKKRVLDLERTMNEHDFTVSAMHGEMEQQQRDTIMK